MKATVSRLDRWGAKAEEVRVIVTAAPALSMPVSRERAATSQGRATAALATAATAGRVANKRLVRFMMVRRVVTGGVALIGIAGVAGMIFIIEKPQTAQMTLILTALAALAACAPLLSYVMHGVEGARGEAQHVVAIERVGILVAQAKRLGENILAMSDHDGLSAERHMLLDILLNDLEKAALATKGRAIILQGDVVGQMRRDVRIRPHNRFVLITTGDNRTSNLKIIDLSVSGVAVAGDLPGVGIGSDVVVGSRKAKVVRLFSQGLAFQFVLRIPTEQFDRNFEL